MSQELLIYVVTRNGDPVAAFATPQGAYTFLVGQPLYDDRGYRDKFRISKPIELKGLALLDHIMPNGKKLRHCSGAEVREIGDWLVTIADQLTGEETKQEEA